MGDSPRQGADRVAALLRPTSLMIVGASERSKPAMALVRVLAAYGFSGTVTYVNHRGEAFGKPCARTAREAETDVDLALIMVPATHVLGVLEDCEAIGVRGAVVFSSGFGEAAHDSARQLDDDLRAFIDRGTMAVLGPNTEGFLNLVDAIPASFSSNIAPERLFGPDALSGDGQHGPGSRRGVGAVAVVAQSGGLAFSLMARGIAAGLGFSFAVATGNEAGLEVQDVIEFLIDDPTTRVILMYLEGLSRPERFADLAARAKASGTHLVVAKVGRSAAGARSALSHTGHLAGDDRAYRAIFERFGVVVVEDSEDMISAAAALAWTHVLPTSDRGAVVSLSGGSAVWLADSLDAVGVTLPELSESLQSRLLEDLPGFASVTNPVDVSGSSKVPPAVLLDVIAESDEVDIHILVTTLARADRIQAERPGLERLKASGRPTLIYTYTAPCAEALEILAELEIPWFAGTRATAVAAAALVRAGAPVGSLTQPAAPRDVWAASSGGRSLSEYETKQVLADYGIAIPPELLATSEDEAVGMAERIGFPVVLKIQSPDIPHKASVGGVARRLAGEAGVRHAYRAIVGSARGAVPEADLHGVLVQPELAGDLELMIGITAHSGLGPMLVLGLGGSMVELVDRSVVYPAPVDLDQAWSLWRQLRIDSRVEEGSQLGKDLSQLTASISQLAWESPSLLELDLNPVLVDLEHQTVHLVDAVAVVAGRAGHDDGACA